MFVISCKSPAWFWWRSTWETSSRLKISSKIFMIPQRLLPSSLEWGPWLFHSAFEVPRLDCFFYHPLVDSRQVIFWHLWKLNFIQVGSIWSHSHIAHDMLYLSSHTNLELGSTVGILGSILAICLMAFNFLANISTKELCLTCRGTSVLRQSCIMWPSDSLARQPTAQMVLANGLYLDSRSLFCKILIFTYFSHRSGAILSLAWRNGIVERPESISVYCFVKWVAVALLMFWHR